MAWSILRRLLFALEPEAAHRLTARMIRLFSFGRGRALRIASGTEDPFGSAGQAVRVWDLELRSRVGLAAGFDKDGELLEALPHLGFGFVEIGTVTPRPQSGNPRPRLFRAPERRALFNRMGFNGLGASIVSALLTEARAGLPEGFRVGVNVGKNKDTSAEDAPADFARAAAAFEGLADYLVINVSSPNTPGLRALQALESLRPIVGETGAVIGRWKRRPPLLLKLAPELEGEGLHRVLEAGPGIGIDGWVLTNTLAGTIRARGGEFPGGWSGGPLTELSGRRLREARKATSLPIISVGGILSPEDAVSRIRDGAALVQLYTGWIYGGPRFPGRVSRALERG